MESTEEGGWKYDRVVVEAGSASRSCLPLEIALGGFECLGRRQSRPLGVAEVV